MKRVKDESGNIIPGLLKDEKGALVVSDVSEYNKYKKQKEFMQSQSSKIDSLGKEVEELKRLIKQLLNSNN